LSRKIHRDKLQVFVDALIQCQNPTMKTKIKISLGGTHKTRKERFAQLLGSGLIEEIPEPITHTTLRKATWFKTTQRGNYAIALMKSLNDALFTDTTKQPYPTLLNV